ncbi:MAG TPA: ABC transporter permease subunit [Egibacteraceae bacterium]|nr:ABC transporter permease subunit [Egibacteraceae bacterium]
MTPTAERPDWRLVARKELGDLLGRLGRKPLTRTLGVVAVFGLLLPLRFQGAANLPAFFAVFMAFLPARLVAVESFAGERERGTLESLLALPLTDRSIAVGKIAAAMAYGAVRGWLFVAVWLPAAVLARAVGLLAPQALPSAEVVVATLLASVVVAGAAALFGVWQSAAAPSVRAILESGGLLRLVLIVTVFFVGPWLLGLLSPGGAAPTIALPGGGRTVSLPAVRDMLAVRPGAAAAIAGIAVGALVAAGIWLVRDTLRRCRREALAMAGADRTGVR